MISPFKYISPVQEAYSKVVEAENAADSNSREILDSKKGNPYRMTDEERKLFYQGEIKRLRRIQKYYEQQNRLSNRTVTPQGYASYALNNTIEKYRKELEKMNQTSQQTNSVPSTSAVASQAVASQSTSSQQK